MIAHGCRRHRVPVTGIAYAATSAAACAAFLAQLAQRRYMQRRIELADKHRLQFDLLCKAMDDPELAAVLDTYDEEIPTGRQRQFLLANALYGNLLHAYRLGTIDTSETLAHLRGISQSAIFRDYWDATRHHREALPATSQERTLAAMVDTVVARASEERDRWWVT
ncbi:DUF6082 family protein [Streptomyces sp. NBC_00237]|uniref:DUF6082 family protein n=1 Tax=Streptomyces sp. NBC_00237 TaxID=2975687 RepID=UPI002253D9A4|nr:DUF6082 family protein [Streptomyces sp. NBC_00237]MCX5203735.1 DUF6082 family protein [Streptomyces sp. NBC_00237]